jgi:hypothetical protein
MSFDDAKKISFNDEKEISLKEISFFNDEKETFEKEISFSMSFEDAKEISFNDEKEISLKEISFSRDLVLDVDDDAPQALGAKLALPQHVGADHVERTPELPFRNRLVVSLPLEPLEVLERSEDALSLLFGVENCLTDVAVLLPL